jgi:BirA family transcriptional regulator, biotin operon repressor / biotin---[acetyl-CoA-carboxylase] ligase
VIGEPRLHEPECESTQQLLLDRADELPEGAVATSDHQTGGRGRLGRAWEDEAGMSVLCSVLLRPSPDRSPPELSLVAAAATAEAIELETELSAQIKWPNDVMLDRRKVSGGIAELRDGAVVLGIGLNVNQTPAQLPADAKSRAGSLRSITGVERDREEILTDLLGELDARYAAWHERGLDALYEDLGARDFLRGRRVTVDGVEGVAEMITRDGRLAVKTASGPLLVESGEVLYER